MKPARTYPWPTNGAEARALQRALAPLVVREDRLGPVLRVAGVDLGFPRTPAGAELGRAALVVLAFPDLAVQEEVVVERPVDFPYIPGLLAFREAPVALAAFERLREPVDLIVVDGHGLAHPRRFGIACHLGVTLDVPAIGCAKSILAGRAAEPGPEPGDWTPLVDRDEVVGAALRTRRGAKPVYVSIGHRVSLGTAIGYVLKLTRGYRLPEPTRLADRLASSRAAGSPVPRVERPGLLH